MQVTPTRGAFRIVNRGMLLLWRLGLGGLLNSTHRHTGRVMVLGTRGRRSGQRRLTPLNYAPDGTSVLCLAGWGAGADWYRNLQAFPGAEVWLPEGRFVARAEAVEGPERLRALRRVLQDSGFAAPLFAGLDPWTLDDVDLARQTADYRVVRLRLLRRRRGPGGPGDLAMPAALVGVAAMGLPFWLALGRGGHRRVQ